MSQVHGAHIDAGAGQGRNGHGPWAEPARADQRVLITGAVLALTVLAGWAMAHSISVGEAAPSGHTSSGVITWLGQLLLCLAALLVLTHSRSMWLATLCMVTGLAIWQGIGLAWLEGAMAPMSLAWAGGFWFAVIGSNVLPAVGIWCALAAATRVWRRQAEPVLLLCSWPLAWCMAGVWRGAAWWGEGYGSLALGLVDLPLAATGLARLGANLLEGLCWGLAVVAAWGLLGAAHGRVRAPTLAVGLMLSVVAMLSAMSRVPWTVTDGDPVAVTVVQPGASSRDWSRDTRDRHLQQLHRAIVDSTHGAVLVTPESYFNEPPPRAPEGVWLDLLRALRARAQHLLVGLPMPLLNPEFAGHMNTVLQISPSDDGAVRHALYAKRHLAPGGELLPWPALLTPLFQRLLGGELPRGHVAGPVDLAGPLFVAGHGVAVSICHELAFEAAAHPQTHDAAWMLNVADDSWIDRPAYRAQVHRLARLRAMEAAKPMLRVSSGHRSALFDHEGRPAAIAPDAAAQTMHWTVQPRNGTTPAHFAASGIQAAVGGIGLAWIGSGAARSFTRSRPRRAAPTHAARPHLPR